MADMNTPLIFAIFGLFPVNVNGTFTISLNFVQTQPLRYTPSTRRRCIAGKRGWIRCPLIDRLI